jgi:RimJ/RimL family protein N-acetyltransferase
MCIEDERGLPLQIIENPTKKLFEEAISKFNRDLEKGEMLHMARCKPIKPEEAKKWLRLFKSGKTLVSIALIGGEVAGAGHIRIYDGKKDHSGVISVAVFTSFRNNRVGERIFKNLVYQAKKKGLKRIESEPSKYNKYAIRIEEKLDFEKICEQKGKLRTDDGRYVTCLYMVRFLDETLK